MKITKILFSVLLTASVCFMGCKPKDSDIQASIEQKIKADPDISSLTVNVNDGVATLSGECKDNMCKAKAEETTKSVKGVKSVVNNASVAAPPPPPAPVVVAGDDALTQGVMNATKDHPTVKASVNDGVITLTGNIKRDQLAKLMMSLNTLKPKKIQNQLTINK